MDNTYHDISLFQGDSLTLNLELQDADGNPFDLTSYTGARGQIRKSYEATAVSASFTIVLNVSDTAGLVGTIDVSLTPTITATLAKGRYVYDIELYIQDTAGTDTSVYKILHGTTTVKPEVTRI